MFDEALHFDNNGFFHFIAFDDPDEHFPLFSFGHVCSLIVATPASCSVALQRSKRNIFRRR
jgi:hypothetical protein